MDHDLLRGRRVDHGVAVCGSRENALLGPDVEHLPDLPVGIRIPGRDHVDDQPLGFHRGRDRVGRNAFGDVFVGGDDRVGLRRVLVHDGPVIGIHLDEAREAARIGFRPVGVDPEDHVPAGLAGNRLPTFVAGEKHARLRNLLQNARRRRLPDQDRVHPVRLELRLRECGGRVDDLDVGVELEPEALAVDLEILIGGEADRSRERLALEIGKALQGRILGDDLGVLHADEGGGYGERHSLGAHFRDQVRRQHAGDDLALGDPGELCAGRTVAHDLGIEAVRLVEAFGLDDVVAGIDDRRKAQPRQRELGLRGRGRRHQDHHRQHGGQGENEMPLSRFNHRPFPEWSDSEVRSRARPFRHALQARADAVAVSATGRPLSKMQASGHRAGDARHGLGHERRIAAIRVGNLDFQLYFARRGQHEDAVRHFQRILDAVRNEDAGLLELLDQREKVAAQRLGRHLVELAEAFVE